MSQAHPSRFGGFARLIRQAMVALAIACQVGAAPSLAAGAGESPVARLAASAVLCQGAQHTGNDGAPAPHQRLLGQALVGATPCGDHLAAPPACGPSLPRPSCGCVGEAALAGARAPPRLYAAFSYSRGPPRPV